MTSAAPTRWPKRASAISTCGTSGGVWGLERGYCMMIGGDKKPVDRLDPIFKTLAPGAGDIPKTPDREKADPRAWPGLYACRPAGLGPFRQDGP